MRFPTLVAAVALAVAPVAVHAQHSHQAKGLGDWSVVGSEINTGKPFEDVQVGWPTSTSATRSTWARRPPWASASASSTGSRARPTRSSGSGSGRRSASSSSRGHVQPRVPRRSGGPALLLGSSCVAGTSFCYDTSKTLFAFTFPVGVVGGFPWRRIWRSAADSISTWRSTSPTR